MIHKLDEIVFDKVCSFIASNDMKELGLDYIEVNLSVAQLCDEELFRTFIARNFGDNVEDFIYFSL